MRNQLLIKTLAVILLAFSLGLHWLMLQSVAWASMALDFVRQAPIAQAIQQTFAVRNACFLCHAIAQGQQDEHEQEDDGTVNKIEAVMHQRRVWVEFPQIFELSMRQVVGAILQRGDPHTPPPRVQA